MFIDVLIFAGGALIGAFLGGYISYSFYKRMFGKQEFWLSVFINMAASQHLVKEWEKINEKNTD